MKFLVDNQLPMALCRFIASQGCDCDHVFDLGLEQALDVAIWQHAQLADRVIVSKDEDFFHLVSRLDSVGRLVWVRLGNCRTPFLLSRFEQHWPKIMILLKAGERVVEIR